MCSYPYEFFKKFKEVLLVKNDLYEPAIKDKWSDDSYNDRNFNNKLRLLQYDQDKQYLHRYATNGSICDIGCGTGEFLEYIQWSGSRHGLEISDYAMSQAKERGFDFSKNILNQEESFDVVLFRGTIQHVDTPFYLIKKAYQALKPGGVIVFLATPNSESILYRLKGSLPALNPDKNFYVPGSSQLSNALENFKFQVLDISYPYLNTPYAKPISDHLKFLANALTPVYIKHPFWKSMMNLVARK